MAAQARPIDGAEGYRLFLEHDGHVELDEINEHLRGLGLRELQPRSMTHFHKLRRYGYQSYVTQNRLDLAVAGEAAWSDDMRAQYPEVRRSFAGQLLFDTRWHPITVESLGTAAASVTGEVMPAAGTSVVLHLDSTGIERTALVSRHDPTAGRADLVFDTHSSLPTAGDDAPYELVLTMPLVGDSENLVAVSDLLVRIERLVTRLNLGSEEIHRVASLRKSSPLAITLIGDPSLPVVGTFIVTSVAVRLGWYQGTKAKYEAAGIQIDNEQKQRKVQQEADAELVKELVAEEGEADTPRLDELQVKGFEKGEPDSMTRRGFIDACRAVIALPAQLAANSSRRQPKG